MECDTELGVQTIRKLHLFHALNDAVDRTNRALKVRKHKQGQRSYREEESDEEAGGKVEGTE